MSLSHRATTLLSAAVLAALASPLHATTYKIHWYLGHPNLDYFEEAAANFKKAVEAESKGDIEVRIVTLESDAARNPAAQSPSSAEIASKVEKGEIEMGHSFTDVMGAVDPRLMAFEAPYLARGYSHMEGVFNGPVGADLLDGLRKRHLIGLSFTYSGGANGVASVSREIRRPEDLKGLKVGVFGDKVNEAWLSALGAAPVAIGHDIEGTLAKSRDGSLDAVVTTWRNFERAKLDPGFKYFSLPGSTYLVSVTYINEKFFNSLPPAYQKLLREESLKAGRIERAKTIELNEAAKREMLGKGVRPVYLSEDAKARFAEALKPAYRAIEGVVGKDLLENIRVTPDAAEHPSVPADAGR